MLIKPSTYSPGPQAGYLLPQVTELLQLVAALGLELDGLPASNHPFLHRVLMLHLCDRIAKVNRRVRSSLLAQLSIRNGAGEHT
jgi:hypothetical protein